MVEVNRKLLQQIGKALHYAADIDLHKHLNTKTYQDLYLRVEDLLVHDETVRRYRFPDEL
jgi:hypothetical protein